MATNTYTIGTLVQMTATFSVGGTNTDPGVVSAEIKDPSGAVTALTPIKDAVGVYHTDYTTSLPGVHYYRFAGSSGVTAAGESAFVVAPSNV